MDQVHSTTELRKGKHLSFEERVVIQTRLKDGWNVHQRADRLHENALRLRRSWATEHQKH